MGRNNLFQLVLIMKVMIDVPKSLNTILTVTRNRTIFPPCLMIYLLAVAYCETWFPPQAGRSHYDSVWLASAKSCLDNNPQYKYRVNTFELNNFLNDSTGLVVEIGLMVEIQIYFSKQLLLYIYNLNGVNNGSAPRANNDNP